MAVRFETEPPKQIAVIEIPEFDRRKFSNIKLQGSLSLLSGFLLMILGTLFLGKLIAESLPVHKYPAAAGLLVLTIFGSLGVGIYLLVKINERFDEKIDDFLKGCGWDGEMSYRIDDVD